MKMQIEPVTETQKYVKAMAERMGSSAITLTIFTENFYMATDALLQFAVCCMLDKPLFLVVPHGVKIPESVKKIAVAIEFFDPNQPDTLRLATSKLLSISSSMGFTA